MLQDPWHILPGNVTWLLGSLTWEVVSAKDEKVQINRAKGRLRGKNCRSRTLVVSINNYGQI
jgi:hypothetical protein